MSGEIQREAVGRPETQAPVERNQVRIVLNDQARANITALAAACGADAAQVIRFMEQAQVAAERVGRGRMIIVSEPLEGLPNRNDRGVQRSWDLASRLLEIACRSSDGPIISPSFRFGFGRETEDRINQSALETHTDPNVLRQATIIACIFSNLATERTRGFTNLEERTLAGLDPLRQRGEIREIAREIGTIFAAGGRVSARFDGTIVFEPPLDQLSGLNATVSTTRTVSPLIRHQITEMSAAFGVDPQAVLAYVQNARVTQRIVPEGENGRAQVFVDLQRPPRSSPREAQMAANLAEAILYNAYNNTNLDPQARANGNFSMQNLANAAAYVLTSPANETMLVTLDPQTQTWVNGQSRRLRLPEGMELAVRVYATLRPYGRELAEQALERLVSLSVRAGTATEMPSEIVARATTERGALMARRVGETLFQNEVRIAEAGAQETGLALSTDQEQALHREFALRSAPSRTRRT